MRSLGHIPFDMDVMKTYGYEMFWPKIMKSLLEPSIVDAWNTLCRNERQVFFLKSRRVSPFPWGEMEKYTTRMLTYERLLFFYGLFIGTLGIGVGIAGVDFIYKVLDDPTRIFALSVGIAGIVIALLGIVRK